MAGLNDEDGAEGTPKTSSHPGPDFERAGQTPTPKNDSAPLDRNTLNAQEQNQGNLYQPTKADQQERDRIGRSDRNQKTGKKVLMGGALGGIIVAAVIGVFATLTTPFTFLEQTMSDLNTSVGSLMMARNTLVLTKFLYKSDAVKGSCTVVSIRCRFSTLSKAEVARMERAGFKITAENKTYFGRIKPQSIEFQGSKAMTPQEYIKERSTNRVMRTADLRAGNMAYLSTVTGRFTDWVLRRFGVSKAAPGLKGSRQDKINQLLTGAGVKDIGDIRLVPAGTDEDGKPLYALEGDTSGQTYTEAQKTQIEADIAKYKNRPVMNRIQAVQDLDGFKKLLSAVSIIGWADMACTLNSMIGTIAVASKTATLDGLIDKAQPFFALMQKIKAGEEANSEDVAALASIATRVDDRETIYDAAQGKTVANPNYGTTPLTSPLVRMSSDGKYYQTTAETTQFSSGLSVESLLGGAAGAFYTYIQGLNKPVCASIQNWFVRGTSLVVGIFAAIGTGGAELAYSAGAALAVMGAMSVAQVMLSNAIHGPDLAAAYEEGGAESIGSAWWIAEAGIFGAAAQAAGLMPGNETEIMGYQKVLKAANDEMIAVEQEDGQRNPFDITNQYSFAGSMSRQLASTTNYSSSPLAVMRGIVALATGGAQSTSSDTAYAAELPAVRFQQCKDSGYLALGIAPDAACNLRYVSMPEDIEKLEQENGGLIVAQWMEDNGYVDKDTTTGLPIGYQPVQPEQSQGVVIDTVKNAASSFVGQFYSSRVYGSTSKASDYGKFLDFCAYRTMPFGEQYKEESPINPVEDGWLTGKKCLEHSDPLSYFRTYTAFLATEEANGEEAGSSTSTTTETPTTGGGSTTVGTGGLAWVLGESAWKSNRARFLRGHYDSGNYGGGTPASVDISYGGIDGKPVYAISGGTVTTQPLGRSSRICSGTPNGSDNGGLVITSNINGHTLKIYYVHGKNVTYKVGATVATGAQIMEVGNVGNSCGSHLHMDVIYDGASICPQDLFLAMDSGNPIDFAALVAKRGIGGKTCQR